MPHRIVILGAGTGGTLTADGFPEPHGGPLPLLAGSRPNHLAKLAFQWVCWNVLLPGHDLPASDPGCKRAGRDTTALAANDGGSP